MKKQYKITYGETMPIWTRDFPSWREAAKFIKRCLDVGDIVFGIQVLERTP